MMQAKFMGTALAAVLGCSVAAGLSDPAAAQSQSQQGQTATMPQSSQQGSQQPSGTKMTDLSRINAGEVVGQNVVNAAGEEIGEVEDLVVDPQDKSVYAVVSVGGFLGIGDKNVAIPYEQLQMGDNNVILMSQASEEELKSMPTYEKGQYQPLGGMQPGGQSGKQK